MTRTTDTDATAQTDAETITLTLEIDPSEFDAPRKMMWDGLIEEYGQSHVKELIAANISQDLTDQTMQLINALWDNRGQIQIEPEGVDTPQVPDQPGGIDD